MGRWDATTRMRGAGAASIGASAIAAVRSWFIRSLPSLVVGDAVTQESAAIREDLRTS